MKRLAFAATLIGLVFLGFLTVFLPPQILSPEQQRPFTSPSDVGLPFEEVFFTPEDQNIKLNGWWIPAANPEKVIIFVHGAGGNKEWKYSNGMAMYKAMVNRNISVLAIDLRNHGTSGKSSDGRMQLGLTEKHDVIAALDYLDAKGNRLPTYLMGNSMGGATVIYTAAEDKRVSGLILLDPVLDIDSTAANFVSAATGLPLWAADISSWSSFTFFGLPQTNAFDTLAKLELPVLFIQDEKDPVCEAEHAQAVAKQNRRITLWMSADPDEAIYDKLDLGGFGTHSAAPRLYLDDVVGEIIKFLG